MADDDPMDDEELTELRLAHHEKRATGTCDATGAPWPCETSQLIERLDAAVARVAEPPRRMSYEELEALPDLAVVLDSEGNAYQKRTPDGQKLGRWFSPAIDGSVPTKWMTADLLTLLGPVPAAAPSTPAPTEEVES